MSGKILILGHGRHGKDTAAEYLRDKYGLSFVSSSYACAEILKPVLDLIFGEHTVEEHFNERHDHRELWKRLISLYNAADATALTKLILSKNDMYVGMRSLREFEHAAELFGHILWIDASARKDPDPTMQISYTKGMYGIDNNGPIRQLHFSLDRWYSQHYTHQ